MGCIYIGSLAFLGKKFKSAALTSIFSFSPLLISLATVDGSIPFLEQYHNTASMCVMLFSSAICSILSENVFAVCIKVS